MTATPNSQFDGPPYPPNSPYYEAEALTWFSYNKDAPLPWHTYGESVELVKAFYESGATKVEVVVDSAERSIPSISALQVYLPIGDITKRAKLIVMARTESQLEAQPHMEKKEVADEVYRNEAALAKSDSPGPVPVAWEIL